MSTFLHQVVYPSNMIETIALLKGLTEAYPPPIGTNHAVFLPEAGECFDTTKNNVLLVAVQLYHGPANIFIEEEDLALGVDQLLLDIKSVLSAL